MAETCNSVREELDNYGGHVPVLIETQDGELYEVESVESRAFGQVTVTLVIGEKYEG